MTRRHVPAIVAAALAVVVAAVSAPVLAQPAPGQPALTVAPASLSSLQGLDARVTHELSIGNGGGAALEWQVFEDPDDPWRRPVRPVTPVAAGEVPEPGGRAVLEPFPGHRGRPGWTVEPPLPPEQEGTRTLTHSGAKAIVAGSSVACSRTHGALTTASGYLRHFTLDDYAVLGDLDVTAVSFGVESVTGVADLTVNLYTIGDPARPLGYDNLDLIGTAGTTLRDQRMTMVEVPVTGTVPAGSTLVVEVATPDLRRGGFFLGAHPGDQTAPSYLRAEACGIPEPAPTGALGFPHLQLLLNVTGVAEVPACRVPGGTSWVEVDPVAGAVAPGGAQAVEVRFDSTGLPDQAAESASLCLTSNDPDPDGAFRVVPLHLRTDQRCDRTVAGGHPEPLTVAAGVTCLAPGARIGGAVNVLDGAGLLAASAVVQGPLSSFGATDAELTGGQVTGPVSIRGTTGSVRLSGVQVVGSVLVVLNQTSGTPIVVADNWIVGSLFCTGNQPSPTTGDGGTNTVLGGQKLDQCASL